MLRPERRAGLLGVACLSLAVAASLGPALASRPREAGTGDLSELAERRLVGDWEVPDAFLVGHERIWQETTDALLGALRPHPVYFLAAPPRGPGRLPGPEPPSTAVLRVAHTSAWVRDYGPIQVRRGGSILWLDADYHPGRAGDDAVPVRLSRLLGASLERVPVRLEGGAIASDGRGLCVVTTASFRNLHPAVPRRVAEQLGCRDLVPVPALSGEPTGHADMVVHFLAPDLVAVASLATPLRGAASSIEPPDPDADRLDRAADLLRRAAARTGRALRVIRIPAHRGEGGEFFSYVNALHLEETLLVPDFRAVPAEIQTEAYRLLEAASGKRLAPIPADDLALVGGGLHCIALGLHLRSRR